MAIKFNLSIDDYCPARQWREGMMWIAAALAEWPGLKVSLFIPACMYGRAISEPSEWLSFTQQLPGECFEFCVHGWEHTRNGVGGPADEWATIGREEAVKMLQRIEAEFREAKLPMARVFKAPNWRLSDHGYAILKEGGYAVVSHPKLNRPGDIISSIWHPFVVSTHISAEDGNTNFIGPAVMTKIREGVAALKDVVPMKLADIAKETKA